MPSKSSKTIMAGVSAQPMTPKTRTVTAKDLARLVRFYEYLVKVSSGRDFQVVRKRWQSKLKIVQQLRDLRSTDNAEAVKLEGEMIQSELVESLRDFTSNSVHSESEPMISFNGDTIVITSPSIRVAKEVRHNLKPLVLLGIRHIILSDGCGHTEDLASKIHTIRRSRGQSDLTSAESDKQWFNLMTEMHGQAVGDHIRQVFAGNIPVMAPGPRGYATLRNEVFAKEIAGARRKAGRSGLSLCTSNAAKAGRAA
jgi:hypothetical protein